MGFTAGTYYVEYLISAVDPGLKPLCTQWRFTASTRKLEVRTWRDVPSPTVTAWRTMATNVRNDLAVVQQRPFKFTAAGTMYQRQQLRLFLDVSPGATGATARKGAQIDSVFVARNSSSPRSPTVTTTPPTV